MSHFMALRRHVGDAVAERRGATMTSQPGPEQGTTDVMDHRQRLLNLAYRLLGSGADGEDAVQEAFIRWYALTPSDREAIETPVAWLTTVTSRICLDQLGSARAPAGRDAGPRRPGA